MQLQKVKILGAGSIGNHFSHAARTIGASVDLCDIDQQALQRTKEQIYPARYGSWDDSINLHSSEEAPKGGYDLIIIGTPPDTHNKLAIEAIKEKPKAVLIEKPLCTPDFHLVEELINTSNEFNVPVFVGYDHVVGMASNYASDLAMQSKGNIGSLTTLDVEFREYWGGIFNAHPWLDGPSDTYLGYWQRGGGASGEHSHALNLWQHFSRVFGCGRVVEVSAMMEYMNDGKVDYDSICLLNLRTENGLCGRVVQDVVTEPPRKWARMQGDQGFIEWHCGYQPGCDAVLLNQSKNKTQEELFPKSRPDDFVAELRHIEKSLETNPALSPIALHRGLDTMLVIAAAHLSARKSCSVIIDYSKGYKLEALDLVVRKMERV